MSAALTWSPALGCSAFALQLQTNTRSTSSPYSRAVQVVDLLGDRWLATMTLPNNSYAVAQAVEAFFAQLRGMDGTVQLWHLAREAPSGTMRGTPTLSATAAQGAQSLSITTSVAGVTVKAGDMVGIAGQLVMAAADATAAGTALTLPIVNRLRAAVASGAAVVWDKPKATFRLLSADAAGPVSYGKTLAGPLQVQFLETF